LNVSLVLDNVCKTVLEELAFLFCESQDAYNFDYDQIVEAHEVSMQFDGPRKGKFELAAGRSLCLVLASNMLGIEPDEDQASELADDALKEALNVICGRFMTEAFGEEAVFNLTAPIVGKLEDLSIVDEEAESESMLFFEAEEHDLVVKLTLHKEAHGKETVKENDGGEEKIEKGQENRAEKAANALLCLYKNKKDALTPEVIEICEKYLV